MCGGGNNLLFSGTVEKTEKFGSKRPSHPSIIPRKFLEVVKCCLEFPGDSYFIIRIKGIPGGFERWEFFIMLAWEYARERKRMDMFDDRWKDRRMTSFMIYNIIPTPVLAVV